MADFNIRTVNSKFVTDTKISEVESLEAAQAVGVRSAIAMTGDDVVAGASVATATVIVSDGDKVLSNVAVTLCVAPLTVS